MMIRRAEKRDISAVLRLLVQVNQVHAELRPDLFRAGGVKYTEKELDTLLADDKRPVFVYENGDGVQGYAFCADATHKGDNMTGGAMRTLYIDDICVDERARGKGVGTALFRYVKDYAARKGYYDLTLNVWEGNDTARAFYERCGFRVQKTGMELIL